MDVRKEKGEKSGWLSRYSWYCLLVVWGLIFLYSTSAYNGRVKFHDPAYYFKKQLFATSLGLMGMYLVSFMDYHFLVKNGAFFLWSFSGAVFGSAAFRRGI